jgi:hypothetical protein
MSMCTWFLQNYFKKILLNFVLGRSHMGTLGAKTSQWRLLQVAPRARALLGIP